MIMRVYFTFRSLDQILTKNSKSKFDLLFSTLFRVFFQIIDFILLDVEYLNYMDRYLSLSVIYFSLGLVLNVFNQNIIVSRYQYNIGEISENNEINELFNSFLGNYFNIYLDALSPTLKYVSKFFAMDFDCTVPRRSVLNVPNKDQVIFKLTNF
jgi:hypothetical protein